MKVTYKLNERAQSVSAQVHALFQGIVAAFEDMPAPLYEDKSSKQQSLDLLHSIVNAMAEVWLCLAGWERQRTLAHMTENAVRERRSVDFAFRLPDGRYFALEVQFGNGGRLTADYGKFRTLHEQGKLALGVVVYFDRETAVTADSGLAYYEAADADLGKYVDMPVGIIGVSRVGSETVNVKDLKGLVFPSILGGSGENRAEVQEFIATAILERKPLSEVRLPSALRDIIEKHSITHVAKVFSSVVATVECVSACKDPELRTLLMGYVAEASRSTYIPQDEARQHIEDAGELTVAKEAQKLREKKAAAAARKKQRDKEKREAERKAKKAASQAERAAKKSAAATASTTSALEAGRAVAQTEAAEQAAFVAAQGPVLAMSSSAREPEESNPASSEPANDAKPSEPPAARRVVRVTKAEDQARQQKAAEASRRIPIRPVVTPPSWNAMGAAFAQAFSAENKKK